MVLCRTLSSRSQCTPCGELNADRSLNANEYARGFVVHLERLCASLQSLFRATSSAVLADTTSAERSEIMRYTILFNHLCFEFKVRCCTLWCRVCMSRPCRLPLSLSRARTYTGLRAYASQPMLPRGMRHNPTLDKLMNVGA